VNSPLLFRVRREKAGVPGWLRLVHAASRVPGAYKLQQYVAFPTTSRFRQLIERHVVVGARERVLDVACGIGSYRPALTGEYYGADINAAYIQLAKARHAGHFEVMDCCSLTYPDSYFDHVVIIAATHHLDDFQLRAAIQNAARVVRATGAIHVLDAVLPACRRSWFKHFWFRLDAGRYPRTRAALRAILAECGPVRREDLIYGPLHDCAYFQIGN
jgi:ubiquinone/menaquinone biosynthesis C-methylase UbiE